MTRMILDRKRYEDKVRACWVGKNIGGTMGGPFEHRQERLDVQGFTTAKGEPLPNDDLDLQLVWLFGMERLGPDCINAGTLGELWLSFISPHWNEYGIGKTNMRRGLRPGISGDFQNDWKHSNGAWIRTEIWACTAPGLPWQAARYAIEDAKVDHGAGEGTYAAAFLAALQSAAFVISDLRKCIDLALSVISAESRVAKTVRLVLDSYDSGKTWLDTRNAVLESNKDIGTGWFEAPSNVGYTVLGLLYGEGDFKKSMLTAINCGDDTDCTAATVGATLGILYGMEGIPEDWAEYIGDSIVTISLSLGDGLRTRIPKTCSELTEHVVQLAPVMLQHYNMRHAGTLFTELGDADVLPEDLLQILEEIASRIGKTLMDSLRPYSMQFTQDFLTADLALNREPVLAPGDTLQIDIRFRNNHFFGNMQHPLSLRWLLPEGFQVRCPSTVLLNRKDLHGDLDGYASAVITAPEVLTGTHRLILEVTVPGRPTALYCSFPVFS